jgi:hypothetical protein
MRRTLALIGLAGFLVPALLPARAHAQANTNSDVVSEVVLDRAGNTVPIVNPPPLNFTIPEGTGEAQVIVPVPPRNLDFLEGPGSLPSDRLHIDPYEINVVSDPEAPLTRRPNAILIPASAGEVFLPLSILADSDGDPSGQDSDSIKIFHGFYSGAPNPVPVFSQTVIDVTGTEAPEVIPFTLPAVSFDVEEPPIETGGQTGLISDYVDLPSITGFFLSSDNPADYGTILANGSIIEDPVNGNGISYAVGFTSDVVPEPAAILLLSSVGMGLVLRRRS